SQFTDRAEPRVHSRLLATRVRAQVPTRELTRAHSCRSFRVHVPPVAHRQLVPVPGLHRRRDFAQEAREAAQGNAQQAYGHTYLPFVPPLRIAERGTGGEASRGTGGEASRGTGGEATSRNPSASTCTTSGRLNSGGG